jgi:phosphopantetheinyl transferase
VLEKRAVERAGVSKLLIELGAPSPPSRDVNRRPIVKDWAYTSISHTEGWAAVAHGDRPLGIDIERPREQLIRVGRRVISADEALDWLASDQDLAGLTRLWAAKEAVYKRFGSGVTSTDIQLLKPGPAEAREGAAAVALVARAGTGTGTGPQTNTGAPHRMGVAWSALLDDNGQPAWIAVAWDLD